MQPGNAAEVSNLRVVRGAREVLPRLSLTLRSGEITGLLGPSGCGKTTLIRCLVGVQMIDAGSVHVLGMPAGSPELRSQVGYMTQEPSVYRDLSVRENLRYFAAMVGATGDAVNRVLARVDLTDFADSVVARLSSGQRSRVSLAAALLGSPRLLLLDEPTVGLDPVLRRELWALFHSLAADGVTLLVTSHVMDEATRCQRILLMRDGRILADGAPKALLERTGTTDMDAAFLALVSGDSA